MELSQEFFDKYCDGQALCQDTRIWDNKGMICMVISDIKWKPRKRSGGRLDIHISRAAGDGEHYPHIKPKPIYKEYKINPGHRMAFDTSYCEIKCLDKGRLVIIYSQHLYLFPKYDPELLDFDNEVLPIENDLSPTPA